MEIKEIIDDITSTAIDIDVYSSRKNRDGDLIYTLAEKIKSKAETLMEILLKETR